jgi:hypothetical protein
MGLVIPCFNGHHSIDDHFSHPVWEHGGEVGSNGGAVTESPVIDGGIWAIEESGEIPEESQSSTESRLPQHVL